MSLWVQDIHQPKTAIKPGLPSSLALSFPVLYFFPLFASTHPLLIPPTFSRLHLSIPVLLISAFTAVLPVLEEAGKAGRGSGQCFSGCQSWHINGSRNQFGGSWNQFKGSWPEFCFKWNQIKSNQMVSTKHSEDKYCLRLYRYMGIRPKLRCEACLFHVPLSAWKRWSREDASPVPAAHCPWLWTFISYFKPHYCHFLDSHSFLFKWFLNLGDWAWAILCVHFLFPLWVFP